MSKPFSERKALLLLLLVSFIWGAGFFITDIALRGFSSLQVVTLRFLVGATTLSIIFKNHFKTITKQEIFAGIISGFFLCIAFAIQVYGQYFSTPSISAFLTVTYVVLVPIFSRFVFKKDISKSVILSAFLILIGIMVITLGTFKGNVSAINMPLGIMLTIICAFGWTFQVLSIDYFSHSEKYTVHPSNLTICMLWFAFIFSVIFNIISFFAFGERFVYSEDTLIAIISIIFLGMFSTAFAFLTQNFAQQHAAASKVAIILSLESVFGALLSNIFLGEQFNILMLTGFAIVFIAVILTELSPTSKGEV